MLEIKKFFYCHVYNNAILLKHMKLDAMQGNVMEDVLEDWVDQLHLMFEIFL